MSEAIHTCALLGRFEENTVRESAAALLPHLAQRGLTTLVQRGVAASALGDTAVPVEDAELIGRAQLAVVIGGDGSLLYAARLVAGSGIPLLGINRGRLGFLTDVMPQDMFQSVDSVLEGRYEADHRPLLEARLIAPTREPRTQLALNDVVLAKWETGRILDFETRIDGRFVNSHGADGLVVASGTGSTAYALSCGGPIVDPALDVLVVVPICPHTLADRPIVVSGRSTISVMLHERYDTRAQVTCDGAAFGELQPGGLLEIRPSEHRITLLHPPGYDYFRLLRSKLHWGRGGGNLQR
ncbi:MAG TPA: NAD(+)/NADH kinase [Steroidobacteraceae bacterium]|nr:NAD(+)/NADH kinase [Steroidobacteraceae bacterium]